MIDIISKSREKANYNLNIAKAIQLNKELSLTLLFTKVLGGFHLNSCWLNCGREVKKRLIF